MHTRSLLLIQVFYLLSTSPANVLNYRELINRESCVLENCEQNGFSCLGDKWQTIVRQYICSLNNEGSHPNRVPGTSASRLHIIKHTRHSDSAYSKLQNGQNGFFYSTNT